ncbi:MAG: terpene cyclase/mutase family protein [Verrucomicrobiae bacterium]|nr:terpene cyclase/mutase family protein [Verrucomicrobiae bacterium]
MISRTFILRRRGAWLALLMASLAGLPSSLCAQGEEFLEAVPPQLERMYKRGLDWLARTQTEQGTWKDSYGQQPAVVGLAITAMLAHGDDPNVGPYAVNIKRGLNFILSQQNDRNGYIGNSMYNHGFATLALAESYGHVHDARLGPALQKAVDLILTAQSRNAYGGWRYSPETSDADTTVSGAQMVALFAARNAGLGVPEEAINKGIRFFLLCQGADGGVGYTGPDAGNAPRTAIFALVLALAKQKNSKAFLAASRFLASAPAEQHYFHYYLYYAAQAYFHTSPKAWREWNVINIKLLSQTQSPDGNWEGSFGASFTTAASLLSLALNYRFLPIYER